MCKSPEMRNVVILGLVPRTCQRFQVKNRHLRASAAFLAATKVDPRDKPEDDVGLV
jgi:hypothetical protein